MVESLFQCRRGALFAWAAGAMFPVFGTISLFAVLYNNLYSGLLIYLILILSNLCILLAPTKRLNLAPIVAAKRAALYITVALIVLSGLEIAFPRMFPADYAQTRDLAKSFMDWHSEKLPVGSVVFRNSDQKICSEAVPSDSSKSRYKAWHRPGGEFAYFGYDPDSREKYMNVFHWNAQGYFDHDHDLQKPPGVHRVVVVGDSYVEAVQVPLSRTFHKLWEAALNNAWHSGPRPSFEVIALGRAGTGQVENFEMVRSQAMRYDPDTVVVTLCSNDFCDDDPELSAELVLAAGGVTQGFRHLISHGYFALAFALRRVNDLRRNRIAIFPELLQWSADDIPRVETAWARSLERIKASRDFCRAHGITFLLAYIGSELEVKYALDPVGTISKLQAMGGPYRTITWDMSKSIKRVARYCHENDILLISLLDPLIEAQRETGRLVFGDHYSMFGHEVVAKTLASAISFQLDPYANEKPVFKQCVAPPIWSAPDAVEDSAELVNPSAQNYASLRHRGTKEK
jgi:lysophospholipase L1-like esterase